MKKASLIAVGTEIIIGDINNSNSQWLSKRLTDTGIDVVRHMTVGDDREQIIEALDVCSHGTDLIFLTGGLGPTTDDFTREVVSNWTNRGLVFDNPSWERIVKMLSEVGIKVADSNRQQCFFPEGAKIFENSSGTANAFTINRDQIEVICLPGPPREITAVWQGELAAYVAQKFGRVNSDVLWRWHCLGISESQLGELVEDVLADSGYVTGYRPHIPYVEVKVKVPVEKTLESCQFLRTLDKALTPWLAFRGELDLVRHLLTNLAPEAEYCFLDRASQGILAERIFSCLRQEGMNDVRNRISIITGRGSPTETDHLIILESHNDGWQVIIDGQIKEIPYYRKLTERTAERMQRYCTEKAILAMAAAWFIKLP